MKCDTPFIVKLSEEASRKLQQNTAGVPCGRCYNCRATRVQQWSFRIQKEHEVSTSAYFVTLTYDTNHVPIIKGRYPMTLLKNSKQNDQLKDSEGRSDRSLQAFFKRLRYYETERGKTFDPRSKKIMDQKPIKYYACGEYGAARKRPHYHFIIFNLVDTYSINKAWSTAVMAKDSQTVLEYIPFGKIDIDSDVNPTNIEYVLKYICKSEARAGYEKNDERGPEFSLMSKGLGKNFITPEIESFYNKRLDLAYIVNQNGVKISMPRYYVNKMMTEVTKEDRMIHVKRAVEEKEKKDKRKDVHVRNEQVARQALMKNYNKRYSD